jgi:hypothetical protein
MRGRTRGYLQGQRMLRAITLAQLRERASRVRVVRNPTEQLVHERQQQRIRNWRDGSLTVGKGRP